VDCSLIVSHCEIEAKLDIRFCRGRIIILKNKNESVGFLTCFFGHNFLKNKY
jgi:hypothetical protein